MEFKELVLDNQLIHDVEMKKTGANCHFVNSTICKYDSQVRLANMKKDGSFVHAAELSEMSLRLFLSHNKECTYQEVYDNWHYNKYSCTLCKSPALYTVRLSKGCLCRLDDKWQHLCEQHFIRITPLGDIEVIWQYGKDSKHV